MRRVSLDVEIVDDRDKQDADGAGARTADPDEALDQFRAPLAAPWEVCGRQAELAERIVPPASMRFEGLAPLFR